jgi:hypothetical protein
MSCLQLRKFGLCLLPSNTANRAQISAQNKYLSKCILCIDYRGNMPYILCISNRAARPYRRYKMTKTATFSNGQTRIYNGSASTIAWMITIGAKVQKIGLSRDMETAEKSSRSYITNGIDLYYGNFPEDVRDEVKFVDTKYDYTSIDSRGYARPLSYQKASEARENNAKAIERRLQLTKVEFTEIK